MSAAGFRTSYQDICLRDIRHIYSGFPPTRFVFRCQISPGGITIQDRIRERHTRVRVPKWPPRCFEYVRDYDVILPTAPAFRRVTHSEIKELVCRLYNGSRNQKLNKNNHVDEPVLTNGGNTGLTGLPVYTRSGQKSAKKKPNSFSAPVLRKENGKPLGKN